MNKVLSMKEAVARYVQDEMSVAMGCSLEGCIPFAAGHEILRQGRKNLTLIGPISDILFDQMIGGGSVSKVVAAWIGNVSTGLGYHFRRAVEQGLPQPLQVDNHSNLSVALALKAGATGVPFAVTRSLLGSDIARNSNWFHPISCPFTGETLLAVKALEPDLAIVHAQRADADGNTQFWGSSGVAGDAARAAKSTIVVVEELVDSNVIRSDPNRTFLPGFLVSAVVVEPWGAHPSPVQGYYGHHDSFYLEYGQVTRDPDQAKTWFDRYVFDVADRKAYIDLFSPQELASLKVSTSLPTGSVEFGF